MTRCRRSGVLLAVVLLLAAVLGGAQGAAAEGGPSAFTLKRLDLHDGHIAQFGDTYYLYGTRYACGFQWTVSGSPWCGFGVSTAPTPQGPWSEPTLLFSPHDIDPFTGTSWVAECGATGAGCFNPRMIQRSGWGADDGAFVLWFNSPADWNRNQSNAYDTMGCNGPAGPCGPRAGGPYGSYHKPSLRVCAGNGDFSVVVDPPAAPAIVCTMAGETSLSVEELDGWGTGGTGRGSRQLAGLNRVESPAVYWEPAANQWIMTYSDPNCGYCTGTGTGYATADTLLGPYTAPDTRGAAAPASARRDLSAHSCGGQPRTISLFAGQAWQGIDLWTGGLNQTSADLHFEPLLYSPLHPSSDERDLWRPPFLPWSCD